MLKIKAKFIKLPITLIVLFLLLTATSFPYSVKAVSPTFSITIDKINGHSSPYPVLTNPIHLEGSASSINFPGQLSSYQVQVDWGDGTVDPDSNVNFVASANGNDFSGTWSSSPDHNYTYGHWIITVKLYHQQPPGSESGDSQAQVTIAIGITITTSPTGLSIVVDGINYTAPQGFEWYAGETHTISTTSPQLDPTGIRYNWTSWSDNGAITHNIIVPGTPTTYTAYFNTEYYLTVNSTYGTTSGQGWYDSGATAYATLSSGTVSGGAGTQYLFTGWSGDASGTGLTSNAITMNAPKTATANWKTQDQVSFDVSPAGGGTTTPSGTNVWEDAGTLSISATPNSGYAFSSWSSNTTFITFNNTNSASTTATINGPGTIMATFTQDEYALTVNVVGSGFVARNMSEPYNYGDVVQLTANAATGWSFSAWSGDLTGSANPASITIDGNKAVTATFTINTFTITASAGAGGSISPSGTVTVDYGATPSFTVTPDTGYHILDVKVDGVSVLSSMVGNAYTFAAVSADHSITASFAINTYTITVTQGAHGTISPGTSVVDWGTDKTFTITPDAGYHIVAVIVNGSSVGSTSPYTVSDVTGDTTLTASFATNTFTITVSVGAGGSISPSGTVTVNYGADQAFTITPDAGYHILDVLVDGVSQGAVTSYTFTNVQAAHSITASFAINTFTITFTESGLPSGTSWSATFGSLTQSSTTATITFTGVTNGSYSWNALTPISGGTGTRYVASPLSGTINVPIQTSQNITYAAQYYLTVNSAYGTAGGEGWYNSGASAYATVAPLTVVGSAGTQYVFTQWSGDASGVTSISNVIVMNGPKTAIANWNTQYYLTVISQYGNPHGSGWYSLNSEARFGVTTPIDYGNKTIRVFIRWSENADIFEPEGTIIMNKPSTVTASWETRYLVTFNTTLPNIVLSIPGVPKTLPPGMDVFGMYYPANDLVAVGPAPGVVSGTEGTIYVLKGWTLDGEMFTLGANITFVVEGPREAAVVYGVEHLLVINAVGVSDPFTAAVTIAASTPTVRNLSPTSPIQKRLQQGVHATLTISTPNKIGHGEWAIFKEWSEQIQGRDRSVSFAMLAPSTVNAVFFKVNPVAESIPYSILAALISMFLCYVVERRRKTEGRKNLRLITSGITASAAALIIAAIVSAIIAIGYGINVNELLDFTNWAVVFLALEALAFALVTIVIIRKIQRRKLLRSEKQ